MFIYAILIILPALAFTQTPLAQLEADLYNALDAGKAGKISQSEAETYFLSYDTNKDGEITQPELTAALDKLDAAFAGHEVALFTLFDRDSNGKVDKADIDAVFSLGDLNGDGEIDKAEFHVIFDLVVTHVG